MHIKVIQLRLDTEIGCEVDRG